MLPARFITLEGIEGVGKSTLMPTLTDFIHAHGLDVLATREPGGSPVADRIRQLLLAAGEDAPVTDTELLLMFAARAEHLAVTIEPSLAAGRWVVSDRFTDATYAYQGAGRGVPDSRIAVLEQWVQGARAPDRTLLFDAPVDLAMERARGRGPADRFEAETTVFFDRARAKYLARAEAEPERFRVIDATASAADVAREACAAVADLLPAAAR